MRSRVVKRRDTGGSGPRDYADRLLASVFGPARRGCGGGRFSRQAFVQTAKDLVSGCRRRGEELAPVHC